MIEALQDRCKETEEDDCMNLLEVFTSSKMANTAENPEDWMLQIEDINERMAGVDASYKKSEAEIKIKILAGLPEEYSEVVTSEKKDFSCWYKKLCTFLLFIKCGWRNMQVFVLILLFLQSSDNMNCSEHIFICNIWLFIRI